MSARISSTVWRTLASAALIALASIPRLSQRAMVSLHSILVARLSSASLDRLRVDWRAGAAGDEERRAAEEKLVDAVLRAVLGEFLEIEDLAHAQAHGRDHHPVPGLVRLFGLVRPHLDAPSVGADRGHLLLLAPVAVFELDAGRVAPGVAAPLAFLQAALHVAGADDHKVAAPDRDLLLLGAGVELVVGDGFAVLEPVDAAEPRDIEQHAAAHHLVLG